MAEVRLTADAAAELDALNEPIHTRVLRILERLENWPAVSGAKPLRGDLAEYWRVRTGDYRVLFRVDDGLASAVVIVERIGHRRDFYED
ncbi:MAG: type II toxin-antitoxin system RelE family toxin [Planctomycetaceae bacterium]